MPATNSDSDSDWFEKDEDEILADLRSRKAKAGDGPCAESTTEYIKGATDEYLKNTSLAASTSAGKRSPKIRTADLRKISSQQPLDAFLSAITSEPDFFVDQVSANDNLDRVLIYTRILAMMCGLKLPGFHEEVLQKFTANQDLLEHFRVIAAKLYNKRYKSLWSDGERADAIVRDMQLLLVQSHLAGVIGVKDMEIVRHIRNLIATSDAPDMTQRDTCVEFTQCLQHILDAENEEKSNEKQEGSCPASLNAKTEESAINKQEGLINTLDIYPSLNELVQAAANDEQYFPVMEDLKYNNVSDYLRVQKQLLREDFMIPLREFVRVLKQAQEPNSLPVASIFFEDVHIVLHEEFRNAKLGEMIFVDVFASLRSGSSTTVKSASLKKRKNAIHSTLNKLKTGALLCLATSCDFDNLILARVTQTGLLKNGYIGIQIMRQHNIGNIYGKQLLMFESPAFFEPYHNVYNYLSSCNIEDFPMKQYIVFGETNPKSPAYLKEDTIYNVQNCKFKPLVQQMPSPKKLPLNPSQFAAYNRALTQEFCLIQGPPGTGKTHLSVQLVRTLIDNAPVTPVVLITYTNESLDKFLLKLSAFTDNILRFGGQTRLPEICKYNVHEVVDNGSVNPLLKRLYFVTKSEYTDKFQRLQTLHTTFDGSDESYQTILGAQRDVRAVKHKLDSVRLMFQYYAAREKGIIAMTSTCAAKTNFLFRLLQSSIVIFEEAAEILESHVIACLTPFTEHVIMIGDQMQLQPYTSTFQHSRSSEMNISLFERLIQQHFQPAVLTTQYRMRPAIADLICPIIYEKLYNAPEVETYPLVRQMGKCVYFLAHEILESKLEHEASAYNDFEIEKIVALTSHLIQTAEYSPEDIVILSPYAKQIELIKNKLIAVSQLASVKAATVDSFQGMEANIVLLSLVRSNDVGQIGFLKERHRICVALSRAKQGLYIVGNIKLLARRCKTWKAIKSKLELQEAIGNEFPLEELEEE